ncbi:patatin-like phospholipase family protein, partial [Mycobacterium sp. MBM]|nr:patatin-like phospholipase family protein [Mycobacterium sp. MBM]
MAADIQELRFAVTMNGGVSLAVYIGGVAQELNLISKARPFATAAELKSAPRLAKCNPYTRLLEHLHYSEPYIDVLTGTSAGGINAAALAIAQANKHGDIAMLKPLWLEKAQIEDLLRQPFQSQTPSLLKGDDYFLPMLEDAFARMADKQSYQRSDRDVDLTLTTTLLKPIVDDPKDEFGTGIVERHLTKLKVKPRAGEGVGTQHVRRR